MNINDLISGKVEVNKPPSKAKPPKKIIGPKVSANIALDYMDAHLRVLPKSSGVKDKFPAKVDGKTWGEFRTVSVPKAVYKDKKVYGFTILAGTPSAHPEFKKSWLEYFDFDDAETYEPFIKRMEALLAPKTLEKFYHQKTPNGYGIMFRVTAPIQGNRELATAFVKIREEDLIKEGTGKFLGKWLDNEGNPKRGDDKLFTTVKHNGEYFIRPGAIETRSHGGIFCIAPTPNYKHLKGDINNLTPIDTTEYSALILLAQKFCQLPEELRKESKRVATATKPDARIPTQVDVFNARFNFEDRLKRDGWSLSKKGNKSILFARPGKKKGDTSAELFDDTNSLHIYTSSLSSEGLEQDKQYWASQYLVETEFTNDKRVKHPFKAFVTQYIEESSEEYDVVISEAELKDILVENPAALSEYYDRYQQDLNFSDVELYGIAWAVMEERGIEIEIPNELMQYVPVDTERHTSAPQTAVEKAKAETRSKKTKVLFETKNYNLVVEEIDRIASESKGRTGYFRRGSKLGYIELNEDEEDFGAFRPYTLASLEGLLTESMTLVQKEKKSTSPLYVWPVQLLRRLHDNPHTKAEVVNSVSFCPHVDPYSGSIHGDYSSTSGGIHYLTDVRITVPTELNFFQCYAKFYESYLSEVFYTDATQGIHSVGVALTIALGITMVMRNRLTYHSAPGFLIKANSRNAGKTTLVDILSTLIYGPKHRPQPMTLVTDPKGNLDQAELEKRMASSASNPKTPMYFFDNADAGGVFGSSLMASLLSSGQDQSSRRLGTNDSISIKHNRTFVITGTSISVTPEMIRRMLTITLHNPLTNPEELKKHFKQQDIKKHCAETREEGLGLLLRMAQLVTEESKNLPEAPEGYNVMSSQEFWDDLVRRPILKHVGVDVKEGMDSSQEDSSHNAVGLLINYLAAVYPPTEFDTDRKVFNGKSLVMLAGQLSSKALADNKEEAEEYRRVLLEPLTQQGETVSDEVYNLQTLLTEVSFKVGYSSPRSMNAFIKSHLENVSSNLFTVKRQPTASKTAIARYYIIEKETVDIDQYLSREKG